MHGAKAVLHGDSYDEAYTHALKIAEQKKLNFIHPFDDPDVIAGQGTIGVEILRQHQDPVHSVFVPVGGGGLIAGVAYNVDGNEDGSMGVECADYDNDGRLDFFMTDYQEEVPVLYRNLGDGLFEDVTLRSGVGAGSLPYVTWGAGLRASQYMVLGAKARALLHGRSHVKFDDIRALAQPVLRHRVLINYRAEAEGVVIEDLVKRLLESVKEGTAK